MALALLQVLACASLFLASVRGEATLGVADLPSDDVCGDDTGCTLSLRQLRGELNVQGLPETAATDESGDVAPEAAAEVAAHIAAEIVASTKAAMAGLPGDATIEASHPGNATAEATGGACVGQTGWDVDFARRAYSCAFRSMGRAYGSGRCMAKKQHVSNECGICMGNLIHCGTQCVRECCYGRCAEVAKCVDCGNRHCRQGFLDCAGVDTPPPR